MHQHLEIFIRAVTAEDTLASIDKGEEALDDRQRDVGTDDDWPVVRVIQYQTRKQGAAGKQYCLVDPNWAEGLACGVRDDEAQVRPEAVGLVGGQDVGEMGMEGRDRKVMLVHTTNHSE